MKNRNTLAAVALFAFGGLMACGGDAEPEPESAPPEAEEQPDAAAPQQQMDPEAMALMGEAQQIQQQLAPIQEEAMQDEALSTQLESLQQQVETAMREENSELFDQMEQLQEDYTAAQEDGDQERAQEVGTELQGLSMELNALQSSVLEQPELAGQIEEFEAAQRARMIEIDPEAGELMDRMDEIFEELEQR